MVIWVKNEIALVMETSKSARPAAKETLANGRSEALSSWRSSFVGHVVVMPGSLNYIGSYGVM